MLVKVILIIIGVFIFSSLIGFAVTKGFQKIANKFKRKTNIKQQPAVLQAVSAPAQEDSNSFLELQKKQTELEIEKAKLESEKLRQQNEQPITCAYCGTPNARGSAVCHKCGGKLYN